MNLALSIAENTATKTDPDWWRSAVIYQIYPRSFQDSNGDGLGDLAGIAQRMDYLSDLGVDAIWISPFFTSPMRDFGYDVSNHCDVDPIFGDLADFDHLLDLAHQKGIKVLIDLVLSHTSDQHPWFKESRANKDNSKSNWYVWADAKPDGTAPNNWLSIFGGSAWQWDPRREQYYLHNFLSAQPDLNFHEPEVKDALLDVARFWLDRGVDGFRLDTINFFTHDDQLRDNPPLEPSKRNATIAPSVNPYNHQNHLFDKNRPENLVFLGRFRALLNEYGAVAVGEVGDAQRGIEILGQYTSDDRAVHMCYAFEFLAENRPEAEDFVQVMAQMDKLAGDGWACWAFSNHDVVRHRSRWNLSPAAQRAYIVLLMCLRGTVCIFQGEELGMEEAEIGFDDLQDPYGKEFWPEFKGRDGCRTPMTWDQGNSYSGFSVQRPWLPIPANHAELAVAAQIAQPDSLLNFYLRAIALRQRHEALGRGEHTDFQARNGILTFKRKWQQTEIFCAFNLSDETSSIAPPEGDWTAIGPALGAIAFPQHHTMTLDGWQFCIAQCNTSNFGSI